MTKTVTISALRADSTPYAHHDVIVTLVAGSAGGVVGSNVIVSSSKVRLDANGAGSVVLETNEAITSPATSFYRLTVEGSSPTITRSIRLTNALASTVSWTLAGIQVGDPTTPDRDVSSDYVTIDGQSLTNYLAGVAFLAEANLFTATQSIDVTVPLTPIADIATTKPTVLVHLHPDGGQIVDHIAVAIDTGDSEFRAAGNLVQVIDGAGDPTDEWILTSGGGAGPGIFLVESTDPGELPYLADLIVATPMPLTVGTGTADGHAVTKAQMEAITDALATAIGALTLADIGYTGSGLLGGHTIANNALDNVEGILDRISFNAGGCLTTNIDTSATNPTLEYGECVAGGRVFLNGQTDPDENGHYLVAGDLTLDRLPHPAIFDPPGNYFRTVFNLPGDPADGLTLMWLSNNTSLSLRGGAAQQTETQGSPGRWITIFDPTATGGGGAVDSVNGETGTVVLDAADVGAAPTARAISAGTGLTGGGTLAADRTLAVTYGLAASTAAEGIAIANTPWRAGSFYGTGFTVSNSGTNVASGQVKAMPFYNPVAGRVADRIAIDVHTGSAGSGILYICTDDGTGYPGAVVASGAMSTPTTSTRATATISYTLPRGLLWLVCHGTGTTWAALTLGNQSIYMPSPAAYSANAINCWNATGAGTSTLTSFPAGASLGALNGVQILLRAA